MARLLNDKIIEIKNPDPNQTILNFIRSDLKKTGTKEGCAEGGCGACTIVLGELKNQNSKRIQITFPASIEMCFGRLPTGSWGL